MHTFDDTKQILPVSHYYSIMMGCFHPFERQESLLSYVIDAINIVYSLQKGLLYSRTALNIITILKNICDVLCLKAQANSRRPLRGKGERLARPSYHASVVSEIIYL